MALQATCPAGSSAPCPNVPAQGALQATAALAAFVRAAAAETQSVEWSCKLNDSACSSEISSSSKAATAVPDTYGGTSAASVALGPLLTAAHPAQLLPPAAGDAIHSIPGTTVISGGLGGLGSTVAAMMAAQSASSADAHVLLLGRSGRAPASNPSLQARHQNVCMNVELRFACQFYHSRCKFRVLQVMTDTSWHTDAGSAVLALHGDTVPLRCGCCGGRGGGCKWLWRRAASAEHHPCR